MVIIVLVIGFFRIDIYDMGMCLELGGILVGFERYKDGN